MRASVFALAGLAALPSPALPQTATPPEPPSEWHLLIKDTIGCPIGMSSDIPCVELRAGSVFLLVPVFSYSQSAWSRPLTARKSLADVGVAPGMVSHSTLAVPSDAFDPTVLHCQVKVVLLHREVSCGPD